MQCLRFIYRKPETSLKWRIGVTRILLYVLSTNAQGLYYRFVIHLQPAFGSYSIYVYLVVGRLFSQNYMACSIPSRIIEASVWGEYSTLETHRDRQTGVIHVAMPCLMDPYRIVCIIILKACRGYWFIAAVLQIYLLPTAVTGTQCHGQTGTLRKFLSPTCIVLCGVNIDW